MLKDYHILTEYDSYKELFTPRSKNFTAVFGALSSEKIFMTSATDNFVLYVTNDYVQAQNITRQMALIRGETVYVPFYDDVLMHKQSVNNAVTRARNLALAKLLGGAKSAVVCIDALMQRYPDKAIFEQNILTLTTGKEYSLDDLPKKLISIGYKRTDSVSVAGEYSIRGDIVDIYLTQYPNPIRISFFDEMIESIRFFGADLVSKQSIQEVSVIPMEIYDYSDALEQARQKAKKQKLDSNGRARLDTILGELEINGGNWLNPFVKQSYLADYLPDDTIIIWDEPKLITSKYNRLYQDHNLRFERLLHAGEILPDHYEQLIDFALLFQPYGRFRQIAMQQMPYNTEFFTPQEIVKFKSTPVYSYKFDIEQLSKDVNIWLHTGYDIVLFVSEENNAKLLQDHLHDNDVSIAIATPDNCVPHEGAIIPLNIERGFVSHTNKLAVIGTKDLVHKATHTRISKTKKQAFLTPSAGEYVVHELHGIGMCLGIRTINGSWGTKDFIVVEYRGGDILYVPVEASNLLSRFAGSDSKPQLSKIGGAEFERVKAKVKAGIKEMSIDLIKLYASREKKRGHTYVVDNYLCNEFEASFEFVETTDQLKSISEIDNDLRKNKIMDRILVGDVGFGKTEVALRTAFKVMANGYQVALMAPTTILSQQHYETAVERMKSFDLKVECLNRFRTTAQQKDILERLENGKIDMLVGTHKLLSKSVKFKNLGLLILDEEQRFGVEHKEMLKDMKNNIDVLTLSATPIPRTLHMALTGMRDISTITTPPRQRMPIETFLVEENREMIRDIIIREISRGGQTYLVYNRVEDIDLFAGKIRELVPEADIIVAHGQMESARLEKSIYDFSKGQYNVLICTTIIENGIDIPNANTLIVYDADNLGLSQLYQLRGRVGRSDKQAYAYLIYRENKIISEIAFKRLSSIMENSELGSGFKIAMADLEIRGAGNVLGREQHGHMQKVGYDMYVKLLNESVAEIKGETVIKEDITTTVEIDLDAFASKEYIADSEARMTFYQKMASITSLEEKQELIEELTDIYGNPPKEVVNLLTIITIKLLSHKSGISNVIVHRGKCKLEFESKEALIRKEVFDAIANHSNHCQLDNKELALRLDCGNITDDKATQYLEEFLSQMADFK